MCTVSKGRLPVVYLLPCVRSATSLVAHSSVCASRPCPDLSGLDWTHCGCVGPDTLLLQPGSPSWSCQPGWVGGTLVFWLWRDTLEVDQSSLSHASPLHGLRTLLVTLFYICQHYTSPAGLKHLFLLQTEGLGGFRLYSTVTPIYFLQGKAIWVNAEHLVSPREYGNPLRAN